MKQTEELTTIGMADEFIRHHEMAFLYVSRADCSICHAILPKLKELLERYPLIALGHIDADQVEEVAERFLILTVPVMLLMVNQREYIRADRFVRFERLTEQLEQIYEMYTGK
ncbi:thioredoxin [Paenibacillus sambharensis]|uniref:Thioredoxin n=1 Tax=Paenibacillus sambharensis TaxID=1803190 RepID=A0A2W1LGH0_9BACL|nr:thioredoxin family protein [Paenibacillus sambharensis]PZD97160.1 thioredoxin [Paenibacillus sambharensis]